LLLSLPFVVSCFLIILFACFVGFLHHFPLHSNSLLLFFIFFVYNCIFLIWAFIHSQLLRNTFFFLKNFKTYYLDKVIYAVFIQIHTYCA
jgi:hypothetical protein